jgi:Stress responsive A/B Barrel Domain
MRKAILFIALMTCSFTLVQAQKNQPLMLRHVVMFGWKEGTDTNYIKGVINAFRALPSKIDLIKGFEWGTNNSPEKLNQGLTYCFFVSFASEKDRDAYLVHPAHKAFVASLKPAPDKVTVLDYWAEK